MMHKCRSLALCLALMLCSGVVWAAETTPTPQAAAKAPVKATEKQPYNFVYEMGKQMPTINLAGEVTKEQMLAKLEGAAPDDLLYMVNSDGKILSFRYLEDDRASCKQIMFASPNETMLQFYTNNKKTANTMYKTLRSYNSEWNLVDGYRLVCDKSPEIKLENKKCVYRFWFKKVKPDNRAVRVEGGYYPYPYPYPYYYDYPVHVSLMWGGPWFWGPRHFGPGPGPGPHCGIGPGGPGPHR